MINETLAVLKLCTKFTNLKDIRQFTKHVQIIKDERKNEVIFFATTGYILIKVTRKLTSEFDYSGLPDQLTVESINQACKVNLMNLLSAGNETEIRFPPFDKVFYQEEQPYPQSANFDCKYMALIFQSLESFRKDIGMKIAKASMGPLVSDKANFITVMVNEGLQAEIKIQIAIMPMK